jgi:hypothetical protein
MAIIYTYPTKATPANDDLVLISDSADGNKTKQVKMSNMPGASGAGITQLNGQTLATQSFANDVNVTITSAAGTHTLGWAGTLAYTRGGTGLATLGTKYQRLQVNNSATGLEYVDPIVSEVVQNESGSTITKGTPVSISAWNIGASLSEVIPSLANTASTMPCAGVLNEDIANGASGVMLLSGALQAFDTSAITGSPNEGDVLYVAPTGGFTGTKPTGTNLIQNVGVVTRNAGAGLGSIQIYTTGEVDDIPNLGAEGSIWLGDSNGVSQSLAIGANNTVLTSNGTTASWGAVDLTSDVTGILPVANGGTGAGTFTSGYFLTGAGTGAVVAQQYIDMASDITGVTPIANGGTGLSAVGSKNQVLKSTGSGGLYYSDLNSSFVNLTSAAAVAWDITVGDNAYLALTTGANVLTINNVTDGDTGTLILNGASSTTFSLPDDTNIKSIIPGATTYTPSANQDKLRFVCRVSAGTTYFYWSIDANMQTYVP